MVGIKTKGTLLWREIVKTAGNESRGKGYELAGSGIEGIRGGVVRCHWAN